MYCQGQFAERNPSREANVPVSEHPRWFSSLSSLGAYLVWGIEGILTVPSATLDVRIHYP